MIKKILHKKTKILSALLVIVLLSSFIMPLIVRADTGTSHHFRLSARSYDAYEGEGTDDPIDPDNDFIEPGQVITVDVNYVYDDSATPATGYQVWFNYNPDQFEILGDEGEPYVDWDDSSINAGGIWPAKGTSSKDKKVASWTVDVASDIEHPTEAGYRQARVVMSDSSGDKELQIDEEVVIFSLVFRVKEGVSAGDTLGIELDSDGTRVTNKGKGQPVTVESLDLTVFGEKSDDVSLSKLVLTGSNNKVYATNPAFTAGTATRTFSVVVPPQVTSINIDAEATDEYASVLPGGLGDHSLSVGDNHIEFIVQSHHESQEIYALDVKRLSDDATLKTLSLSGVTLDNSLASGVYTYTATVPYKTTSTTVSATANDSNAKGVTGTGTFNFTTTGTTKNSKTLTVEAENCKSDYTSVIDNTCSSKNYNLEVTRTAPSTNNLLSDIKVDGVSVSGFVSGTNTYTLPNQANSKTSVNITATLADSLATMSGTGTKTLNVGDNTFNIVVTPEDPAAPKNTYTLKIRRLNNNGNLGSLTITPTGGTGTLSPNFSGTFYGDYTYTYDPTVTNINLAATTEVNTATITSGTGDYASGTSSASILVTAEDGTTKTYTIKFSRSKSSDNTLSALGITGYNLNETFSPTKTLYTATVPGTVDSIDVTATPNEANATIVSGTGSHSLSYGSNSIQVRVKAENGATKDYTINVTRSKKTISSLSDLTVDGTTVSGFSENILSYDIGTVPFSKTSILIGAIAKDSDATISGDGTRNLNTGSNTFTVTVTAHDGTTKTNYTITVEREKSSDATLKSLSMTGATISFDSGTKTYNVDVPYETTTTTITAVPNYKDATASVSGPTTMSVGNNTYTITVTAEDGTLDTYTINVNRKKSTNNYASGIQVVKDGTNYLNNYSKTKTTYNVTVPNEVESADIVVTLEDSLNSTVVGDGTKTLTTGLNVYVVEVTAASGDKKSYTLNITRDLNANNNLASLEVAGHALSPSFNAATTSYNVVVDSNTDNVAITATPDNPISTVTGTGVKSLVTGTNTFNIDVVAENNAKKTYVVIVTKQASNDSTLKSLSIDETILDQPFSPSTTNYTASVANSISSIHVNAAANDSKAKGVTGTGTVNLNTGDNTVNVVVTAEDNTTTTYTIVVNRAKSTNANLKSIGLSGGNTLDPSFDKDTTTYNVNVSNATEKIMVSAEKEDSTATVTGTGNITLTTGNNVVEIVVTAEDTSVVKKYKLNIFRALSNNAYLSGLTSSDGVITPAFDKDTYDYNLTVPFEVENANIAATVAESHATASVSGNTNLVVGTNNAVVLVTAENGNTKTYNITITRQPSTNNFLASLDITDVKGTNYGDSPFNKLKTTYNITVANDIDKITLAATPEDSDTTIKGTGEKTLTVGSNTFTIESISANGTPRSYIVNIERQKNSNTKLSSLSIDGHTIVPDFDPDVFSYSLNITDSTVEKVKIEAQAEVSTSTVTGTGEKTLSTGLNTFSVEVSAENGDKKAYVISINKAASDNNYLASLLTDQPMNETFNKNDLNYTVNVENNITSITIQAVAEADTSTVTGTGTHNLLVGDNTFDIVVTAENNTPRTYKVKVNRKASANNYLSDLKVNGVTLSGFDKDTTSYTMTVENDITEANVVATVEDSTASVAGDGKTYLVTTSTNTINVSVTAENGDIKVYTINITRKKSANNNLAMLSALEGTLSPAFDKDTTSYTMQVPYEVTYLNLTAVVEDANAEYDVEGNVDFQIGSDNNVYIPVTSENGSTKTYSIKVTRQPQANNYLKSLMVASTTGKVYDLNPVFNQNTLNYNISIPEDDTSLIVSGTKDSASSTVAGLENISVSSFPYVHTVTVTSAGGIDRNYTITINKVKSSNAQLKGITSSEGDLSPAFDPDVTDYTINVDNDVDSIDIDATTNTGQSVTGIGTYPLSVGGNTVTLTVTAEDGTINTYNITVVRSATPAPIDEPDPVLDSITTDKGTLSPAFTPNGSNYALYVDETEEDVTIIATTPSGFDTTISLNNGAYNNVSNIKVDDLSKGNVVKIKVEGETKSKTYTISILRNSTEKITSKEYGHVIEDGMIKTVTDNTSADELKDQLDNDNVKLKVYQADGETEYTGDHVGTGMIVKLFIDDVVKDQKTIIVKGDTDGNGIINAIDALKVVNHIIGNELLTDCYWIAADTAEDEEINAIDALKIVNHIIGNISLF